ncbi:MAG: aspartate aminotransferase family protein [Candidatus Ratteibacteria bacterium]
MAYWADVDLNKIPEIKITPPGPKSIEYHNRASKYMKGYSSQVKLFPVVFEKGYGYTLKDVDGNTYIDFSSGIYVSSLGHCHPKVSEAICKYAKTLMNCHDFTTPIKTLLLEKLAQITPGDLNGIQLYDSGTTAVEAGLRAARMATGKLEFISFHRDFHGKTLGAVSLARVDKSQGLRAPGFFLVPRGYCYRCVFKMEYPSCNLYCVDYIEEVIKEETTGNVASIVLEPIQGWAGSIIPPDGWIQKIRKLCDKYGILLFADEVLTCMGRTGKMFAMEHYNTVPDIITLGKSFGNGFPVTAMVISERYKDVLDRISASTSYGGNPMACAAALASIEVIEEENLCENAREVGDYMGKILNEIKERHKIVGDVRCIGCLGGIELVKDRNTKEPFEEAGIMVYKKAFQKGLAWVPAGHNLRLAPPIIITKEVAKKALEIIEEAIYETEKELGY